MADRPHRSGGDPASSGDPLEPLDSELTIFALANGMDLVREREGRPCRLLGWFREGLERGILMEPRVDGAVDVSVEAREPRRDGGRIARARLRDGVSQDTLRAELRPLLAEALERANELGEDDLV